MRGQGPASSRTRSFSPLFHPLALPPPPQPPAPLTLRLTEVAKMLNLLPFEPFHPTIGSLFWVHFFPPFYSFFFSQISIIDFFVHSFLAPRVYWHLLKMGLPIFRVAPACTCPDIPMPTWFSLGPKWGWKKKSMVPSSPTSFKAPPPPSYTRLRGRSGTLPFSGL